MANEPAAYWSGVYTRKDPTELSWFQDEPVRSLELISGCGLPREAAIIDVGGGASNLAARLAADGYADVTVLDISRTALEHAQRAAGALAQRISWVQADIRSYDHGRQVDLWHDRAVFHFMVGERDRAGYLATLTRTLKPGGHLLLATFGPQGPRRCSGLPTARYDAASLARTLGPNFHPLYSQLDTHKTPSGSAQQFLWTDWQTTAPRHT